MNDKPVGIKPKGSLSLEYCSVVIHDEGAVDGAFPGAHVFEVQTRQGRRLFLEVRTRQCLCCCWKAAVRR